MAKISVTGDEACLFNAVAIGLAIHLLSGRLDDQETSEGYQRLLTEFATHHPNFQPKSWGNLKKWLAFYNNYRDIELILAPVLFKLNQQYIQKKLDSDIFNQLTEILFFNSWRINQGNIRWDELNLGGDLGYALCPLIDNLPINERKLLLTCQDFKMNLQGYQEEKSDANNDQLKREHIRSFLLAKKGELWLSLRQKILSNPNAYAQGYSCDNLKVLADSLSINLVENDSLDHRDNKNKIYLLNNDQHWDIECDQSDYERFIGTQKKLNFTSDAAYNEKIVVAAPLSIADLNPANQFQSPYLFMNFDQEAKLKLMDIIVTLQINILYQDNDRRTERNSEWKVGLLDKIRNDLAQATDMRVRDIWSYIDNIREVCARRRNTLHFWAEPHSVSEFERMLEDSREIFRYCSHSNLLDFF